MYNAISKIKIKRIFVWILFLPIQFTATGMVLADEYCDLMREADAYYRRFDNRSVLKIYQQVYDEFPDCYT